MKLISRQEAIEQKLTRYFTGEPCKHGHVSERNTKNKCCQECHKTLSLLNKKKKPEKEKERLAKYNKLNPQLGAKKRAKYRASQLQRTPAWDPHAHLIIAKYQLAAMLTKASGIEHHVDHIIPLQGRKVSGLHVFSNLRVIPGSDNVKKSNKYPI